MAERTTPTRKIIHIDMDAFFASVEQRDNPQLRGKPVVVGGAPNSRSVVCAASYEARTFGIHSAMPCAHAYKLCPQALFVPPRMRHYQTVSQAMRAIFKRYTDLIEPLSLDEAYLDVTENKQNIPSATWVAEHIRNCIHNELQLTASAGVAPNKFIAKIASDINKPNGICVIPPEQIQTFLHDLPIRKIPGIGPVTEQHLQAHGITQVQDILAVPDNEHLAIFGKQTDYFIALAHGIDTRPVQAHRIRKSVGVEHTFAQDITTTEALTKRIHTLADELWQRLQRNTTTGLTLTVKIKYSNFKQITRSHTLKHESYTPELIHIQAIRLVNAERDDRLAIRLLGLSIHTLVPCTIQQETLSFE